MEPKNWPERSARQGGSSFNGLYLFMDLPAAPDLNNADFAIVGLPFDGATVLHPGGRFGRPAVYWSGSPAFGSSGTCLAVENPLNAPVE